jgi:hypothetical protein
MGWCIGAWRLIPQESLPWIQWHIFLLDTNTNIIWQYKKATNNAWTRLNLLPSDTTSFNYVNTYGTQTVNGEKTFNKFS